TRGLCLRTHVFFSLQRHRSVLLATGILIALVLSLSTTFHRGGNVTAEHLRSHPAPAAAATDRPIAVSAPAAHPAASVPGHALQPGRGTPRDGTPPAAAPSGIAAKLVEGQRAFSIHVAEDDIVGGFLQSGDHVDILATIPGSVFPQKDALAAGDRSS